MDGDRDAAAASTIVDEDTEDSDFGRFSKPEALNLDMFLADPVAYRPRVEFLGGPMSYMEVSEEKFSSPLLYLESVVD